MAGIRNRQKIDLGIVLVINLIFLFFCLFFCNIFYETNDDNAMALFVEGAYGGRASHLVFENMIWGKILSILTGLVPSIKWYTVGQYFMIFCAFVSLSYIMLRLQGRKIGLVSSVFLLSVFGYNTYIIFQWTRTAAITTIGGMILLFYAIEYAGQKYERRIALTVGACLCIFGSLIRFQFFAICVVLAVGTGLLRFVDMLKKKPEGWKRKIGMYFAVFGTVGVLSIGIWGADRAYYMKNEAWNYYLEYNELRSQLWDLGFPNYEENQELYESLGISENDMKYYHNWNMDTELMPIESMRKLVLVKEQKAFTAETVKNYFKEYPIRFFSMSLFSFFIIVSSIATALNRKNLRIVCYEAVAIMLFELYFFFVNRYGLPRIEAGMWMAAIASVLYSMSEDVGKIVLRSGKWVVVLSGIVLAMNMTTFRENMALEEVSTASSRKFFDLISQDAEKLYCFSMHSEPYKLESSYDFWEPARLGDAANVYYMGGWEFNVPIMDNMLERYDVDNIYRDSVNNNNVLFVANSDAGLIQDYIKENYDESAELIFIKDIDGAKIWRVRNKDVELNGKMNTDLKDIQSDIKIEVMDGILNISGYVYKKDSNSFMQCAYLKLEDTLSGEIAYMDLAMSNLEGKEDIRNGKYSSISGSAVIAADREYNVSVILWADEELYEVAE
jgi:hypothetical protein